MMQRMEETQQPNQQSPWLVSAHLRDISSPLQWIYCLLAYIYPSTVWTKAYMGMLAYTCIVLHLARNHGGQGWLDYDKIFCKQAATMEHAELLIDGCHSPECCIGINCYPLPSLPRGESQSFRVWPPFPRPIPRPTGHLPGSWSYQVTITAISNHRPLHRDLPQIQPGHMPLPYFMLLLPHLFHSRLQKGGSQGSRLPDQMRGLPA